MKRNMLLKVEDILHPSKCVLEKFGCIFQCTNICNYYVKLITETWTRKIGSMWYIKELKEIEDVTIK